MSDCRNGGRMAYERPEGHPTLMLRVEFSDGEPWTYPIALNGRRVTAVLVGGRRYAPVAEPDWDAECEMD